MLSAGSGIFCGGMHGRSESDEEADQQRFQHHTGAVGRADHALSYVLGKGLDQHIIALWQGDNADVVGAAFIIADKSAGFSLIQALFRRSGSLFVDDAV